MCEPDYDSLRKARKEGTISTNNVLGFCTECVRMRWLKRITRRDEKGNPYGVCTECDRKGRECSTPS